MGVNGQSVQPLCLPAWEGDNIYGCFVNGVCMYGLAVVEAMWRPTGNTGISLRSMQHKTWEAGGNSLNSKAPAITMLG